MEPCSSWERYRARQKWHPANRVRNLFPFVSLVCAAQFTSTYRGFRWFSFNASRPSCLLPQEVERCTDNARAFSGVIKGLNPRSFVRRMTLILSTTPSEPATEQAINSSTMFRLHDRLAQILSAAVQRM